MVNNDFIPTEDAKQIYDLLLKTFDGNTEQLIKYYEDLIKEDLQSLNEYRVQAQTEVNGLEKYSAQMRRLEQKLQESSNAIKYYSSLNNKNELSTNEPSQTESINNSEINAGPTPKTAEEELTEMFNQQIGAHNQKRDIIISYANQLDGINLNTQPIIVQDELNSLSQKAVDVNTISNREKDIKSDVEQKISEIKMSDPSFSLSKIAPNEITYMSYDEASNLYRKIASKVKEIETVSAERPDVIPAYIAENQCSQALHIARDEIRTICDPSISFDQIINEVEASLNNNIEPTIEEVIKEAPIQNNVIEEAMQEAPVPTNNNPELTKIIEDYTIIVNQINTLTNEVNEINNKEENLLSNDNCDYDQLIELENNASSKEKEISHLKNQLAIIEKNYFEKNGVDLKENIEISKLNINNISYIKDFNTFITERNKRIDECYSKALKVKQEIATADNDIMKDSCKQRLAKVEKSIAMEESLLERRITIEKSLHTAFDIEKFLNENSYKARKKSIEDKVINDVLNKYPNAQKLTPEQENEVNDIIGQPTSELDKIIQSTEDNLGKLQNIGNQFTSTAADLDKTTESVNNIQNQIPQATNEQEQKAYDALSKQTQYMDTLSSVVSDFGDYINNTAKSYSDNLQSQTGENKATKTTVTPTRVDRNELNLSGVPKATRIKCTIKNGVSITTIRTADNQIQKIIYKNLSNKLNVLKDKMGTQTSTVLPGLSNNEPYDRMTESIEDITNPTNVIENANSDLLNAMHSIGM